MKAIISGATGFLGGAVLRELLKNHDEVTVIVREGSKKTERLKEYSDIKLFVTDMDSEFELPEKEYDVFFHTAWGGGRNNKEEQEANKKMSMNCLNAASNAGCGRFVLTGSQAEYGEVSEKITEETTCRPTTEYGRVKVELCEEMQIFTKTTGIDLVWPRLFSVYGEHDNPNTLWSCMIKAFNEKKEFVLKDDAKNIWNFLYEEDAARAVRLLGNREVPAGIYNLASKFSRPLYEYIEEVADKYESRNMIVYGREHCNINLDVYPQKLLNAIGEYEYNSFPIIKA